MSKPYVILNILCGGQGTRIGGNKPLYPYKNTPLIEHSITILTPQCDEIILSINDKKNSIIPILEKYELDMVFDEFQNLGPLSGILAGMKYSLEKMVMEKRDIIYISAPCDMPLLPKNYVKRLINSDSETATFYSGQRDYPLCAKFPLAYISVLENRLKSSDKGLGAYWFLNEIYAKPIEIENEGDFININSPIIT